jgi:hypothetical protein
MSDVQIILAERVKKDYKQLPLSVQKKFKKQLRFLAQNLRHPSLQIQGHEFCVTLGDYNRLGNKQMCLPEKNLLNF